MADNETSQPSHGDAQPLSRPSTAMRMPDIHEGPVDAGDASTHTAQPDDSILKLLPPSRMGQHGQEGAVNPESSYIEAVTMEQTRAPDETMSEEAVRKHLNDVESSFLPNLSPIATRTTELSDIGADDAYLPESPQKIHPIDDRESTAANTTDVGNTTSSLENLDSSPTAAAAARTISRAVSMASNAIKDAPLSEADVNEHSFLGAPEGQVDSSWNGDSAPNKLDAGATPGDGLRVPKRSKYLRSRFGSQRSSTSSFITTSDSQDGSDATVGHGADYALQSGGALPSFGTARTTSNPFMRNVSMGSMASGFGTDDFNDTAGPQLDTLPEVSSPDPHGDGDLLKTPKPSRDKLNSAAPTDTVIAQHVKNIHVPESLAKEYKFKNGLQTPHRPSTLNVTTGTVTRTGKSLTLKEQSSTIERLSKENFDLKLKIVFLSDRLDKLSEEGIREMISENVDLKTSLAVLQRDNKLLRKRVKDLEKQAKDDENKAADTSSPLDTATNRNLDEDAFEREQERFFLRERVEEYATMIENLRHENAGHAAEKRVLIDRLRNAENPAGRDDSLQDESAVWHDLLEQETSRREQADDENQRLRDEVFNLKKELAGQGSLRHTTNIYNISKKPRDGAGSPGRSVSGLSGDNESSTANFSAATTLVDELRREGEQLRHENAELRREVGAQSSMLTSRNREKERLYQEIEDLKMAQHRGGGAPPSAADSILERSASRAGGHERSRSRGSRGTRQTSAEGELEREGLENKLAESRDKLSEVKLQNQELQRELESCMEDFEAAVAAKREAEENAMALQEDLDAAMSDLVALQSERDEAIREQGEMENEFEALRREAQEEIDALEAEADQRNETIERLQSELRDGSENFDALQEEMRKMSEGVVRLEDDQDGKIRRIQQLEEELDASNKELEELEQKLMEANQKVQRFSIQQESSQGEIAFLREEQEGDKIRIGDLEAALANVEQSLRDEKERAKEIDNRLQQERQQREIVADREKEEVQQVVNELNRETSSAKDEVRRLRKNLSSREVEATEWKERLLELENNLREALGDLNGTRSSLLKSIAKMQRELENTVRELETTKGVVAEKEHIIKQRDTLLESHGLESRRTADLLDKERVAHRNTKAQFDTFQRNHQHLSHTASTQDTRIAELESTRGQDLRKLAALEQSARDQLKQRNELLLKLWQKLSALCGREWLNSNALVDKQVVPSVEVIASRLPGFSKNLMAAIKAIEAMFGALHTKIIKVDKELHREYQTLENNLDVRTKKLDRLETMLRNSVASGARGGTAEMDKRMLRLEDAYRQLKVENATLRTANDVRSRVAGDGKSRETGSPSPGIPRGPGDRDRSRASRSSYAKSSRSHESAAGSQRPMSGVTDVAVGSEAAGYTDNDNAWLLRLRDMEKKLKSEREGRNQDRHAARQRLGGLEVENRDLRDRMRRANDAGE